MPEPAVDVAATVTLTVNGRQIDATPGEMVIAAAERHGVYIPRFCYHPRMRSVGMCRMCLVDIDTGRGPSLEAACMIPVADDMVVDTTTATTKAAQDGVLEFLLINHPLDCPVCDKGGECPLQDQTMAYGPGESRFVEQKVNFEKPIAISDIVLLDRERCILCDRCTRFAAEVAGDPLISFMDRAVNTQVNTFPDHPFASYFSGNTVQICPVGALTATPYRFRARPWDLEEVESTCQTCSVGCRIAVQSSRNQVLRYLGVDVDPVNWGWLCDKGRFGFEAVNSEERLGEPVVRHEPTGDLVERPWSDALAVAAKALASADNPTRIAVLGGARLTNQHAYAWTKLAKGILGTDNVDCQLDDGLPADAVLGLPRATIDDACRPGGTILWLGPDPKEELPVLYLRLRHAIVNDGARLVEVTPGATGLSDLAAVSVRYVPGTAAAAVDAVLSGEPNDAIGDADDVAEAARLLAGTDVTIAVGRPSLAEPAAATLDAVALVRARLPGARFLTVLRRGNVHGALDMGMAPGLLPGRVTLDQGRGRFSAEWPTVPSAAGLDARGVLQAAADGDIDVLVLLGADPLADSPDRDLAERALAAVGRVVAVDLFLHDSARRAEVVLPAAGFGECDGTTTNLEGRVTTVAQAVTPPGTARSDWMIAAELARLLDADLGLESVEDARDEIERLAPSHAGLGAALAAAGPEGVLVPVDGQDRDADSVAFTPPEAPTEERPRDAYALRLVCDRTLYDEGTALRFSPSLSNLAEPAVLRMSPYDFDRLGVTDGTDVRLSSERGSCVVPVVGDRGIPRGAAALAVNRPGVRATELIDAASPVTELRVETL